MKKNNNKPQGVPIGQIFGETHGILTDKNVIRTLTFRNPLAIPVTFCPHDQRIAEELLLYNNASIIEIGGIVGRKRWAILHGMPTISQLVGRFACDITVIPIPGTATSENEFLEEIIRALVASENSFEHLRLIAGMDGAIFAADNLYAIELERAIGYSAGKFIAQKRKRVAVESPGLKAIFTGASLFKPDLAEPLAKSILEVLDLPLVLPPDKIETIIV